MFFVKTVRLWRMQGGPDLLIRAVLQAAVQGISPSTQQMLMDTVTREMRARNKLLQSDRSDRTPDSSAGLFFFLTEHLQVLQECSEERKDACMRSLLEVYSLFRKPGALLLDCL